MPAESLPPCTPNREGKIDYIDGEAVICRSGRWEPFEAGGPPDRLRDPLPALDPEGWEDRPGGVDG